LKKHHKYNLLTINCPAGYRWVRNGDFVDHADFYWYSNYPDKLNSCKDIRYNDGVYKNTYPLKLDDFGNFYGYLKKI
jgi:hypothetical protein